jgi:hypothetical protein
MLINTLQGLGGPNMNDMRAQQEKMMKDLRDTLNQTNKLVTSHTGPEFQPRFAWDFEPPPFPEQNFQNLQKLQQEHYQQRQAFTENLQQQLAQMKEEFFAENHYQTKPGPDGKPQVALNDQGKPIIEKGPENAEQRVAREQFESARKQELGDRQAAQKDSFLKQEKQNIQQFLAQNHNNLADPSVQAQLQQMVAATQKRALGLQNKHEDERWKVDLPTEEMVAFVDGQMDQFRQMQEEQAAREEASPDMRALMEHQQQVAAILAEQKDIARRQQEDDSFLLDPRKRMAALQQPREVDLGRVLPGYLANSLYNMGIYDVQGVTA